jgi:hypothetical protein
VSGSRSTSSRSTTTDRSPSARRSTRRRRAARRSRSSIGDTDVEPDLHLDAPTPVRRQLRIDRRDRAGEEFVGGPRAGHRQDDDVAGLLPKSTPVHQQRRLADRPVAEERGVLRLTLAGPRDACVQDGRLAVAPGEERREVPAAGSEWVRRSRL